MKPRIYIETSVFGYLSSPLSRDIVTAARQQITVDWWSRRDGFELFISDLVTDELGAGNAEYAAKRLEHTQSIPSLLINEPALELANALVHGGPLPDKAAADAIHIAVSVMNGMDYLLTWNFKHIANATIRAQITNVCVENGFEGPVICTPEELMPD